MRKSLAIIIIGINALSMYGKIWVVDTTGAEGDSLQAAIDSAWITPGIDTVLLKNGTYHTAINLDTLVSDSDTSIGFIGLIMRDSVWLISENGAENCILTAVSQDLQDTAWHVIYCNHARDIGIKGFTIKDGKAIGILSHRCGGGIYIEESPAITLSNNKIEHNYALSGGGVIVRDNSKATLINNIIASDSAYDYGGGILIYKNSSATITDNIVTNNATAIDGSGDGGGILISSSSATITGNIITQNYGGYGGGGIHPAASYVTIYDNLIKDNSASNGAGIWILRGGKVHLYNNIIENNDATSAGGGINILKASATSNNNIIRNNYARHGGGIWIRQGSAIFYKDVITDNISKEDGGGISLWEYSSGDFKKCLITANKSEFGGAFYDTLHSKGSFDSCFIVDNGNVRDSKSGLAYIAVDADSGVTFEIANTNLYYNTYQPDTEISNFTSVVLSLRNNFWWYTTDTAISKLIQGPSDYSSWKDNFIFGAPSEPISIDSIRNYNSDYSSIVKSLNRPDTLYLSVYGEDRNSEIYESAVVIIKSSIYLSGIAVTLVETDTNSGIYRGKVYVKENDDTANLRTDDIYQTIRVNPSGDSIKIISNIDTTKKFEIIYNKKGIANSKLPFLLIPHPSLFSPLIKYRVPHRSWVKIKIYNIMGRCVRSLVDEYQESGYHQIIWNLKSDRNERLPSGIYFCIIQAGKYRTVEKTVILK